MGACTAPMPACMVHCIGTSRARRAYRRAMVLVARGAAAFCGYAHVRTCRLRDSVTDRVIVVASRDARVRDGVVSRAALRLSVPPPPLYVSSGVSVWSVCACVRERQYFSCKHWPKTAAELQVALSGVEHSVVRGARRGGRSGRKTAVSVAEARLAWLDAAGTRRRSAPSRVTRHDPGCARRTRGDRRVWSRAKRLARLREPRACKPTAVHVTWYSKVGV